MKIQTSPGFAVFATALFTLAGCSKPGSSEAVETPVNQGTVSTEPGDHDGHDHAGHDHRDVGHPEHGPHGGDLIELGKEKYHAEMVHEDDGISLYVLDSAAAKPVAVESKKLQISLKHDGEVKTFDLSANADQNDPNGKSSRFTSSDSDFHDWLDAGDEGAVVIQIEGKSYTGKVAHAGHDHAGHDHEAPHR